MAVLHAILLSIILGCSLGNPLGAFWLRPIAPVAPLLQYHAQDGSGAYHYSYTGPHHAKTESSSNGITQGGYSYIDPNGILQTVAYSADAQNGFRVSASNLPQQQTDDFRPVEDTLEAIGTKINNIEDPKGTELRKKSQESNFWQDQNVLPYRIAQPIFQYSNGVQREAEAQKLEGPQNSFLLTKAEADKIEIPKPTSNLETFNLATNLQREAQKLHTDATPISKLTSLSNAHQQIAVPARYLVPIIPYRFLHSSLHHTQDSLGQYDYSYTGDTSAKSESRSLDGTTRGAYSYVDANGLLQQVHYIADHNGFRVAATNLPEAK